MPVDLPPTEQPNYRLIGAYALFGFGGPICYAAGMVFWLLFLPGRGFRPPLAPFHLDHPAAIICAIMLAVGLTLIFLGRRLLKSSR